jgi:mannose-6-phosphate isomerase-like protein (cupin superfamily)
MTSRRRVVTGKTPGGVSVVTSDQQVEPVVLSLLPGFEFHRLWESDTPPALPGSDDRPSAGPLQYFPPPGGYRAGFFTVGPQTVELAENVDVIAGLEELERNLPGMAAAMEIENPGMHTTETVDVDCIMSGEVWLELDDGKEVHLRAGDVVIQNGTRHRWTNKTDQPCVVFIVLLGATRA